MAGVQGPRPKQIRLQIVLGLAGWGSLSALPGSAQTSLVQARVVQVIGGTEALVDVGGQLYSLNLAYQFVPNEASDLLQQQATQALSQLLPSGSLIQIEPVQIGSGNRITGFVYGDSGFINAQLLAQGLTVAPWDLPDPTLQMWYDSAIAQAQAQGLGLYAQAPPSQQLTQQMGRELQNPSSPLLPTLLGAGLMVVVLGVIGMRRWRRQSWDPSYAGLGSAQDSQQLEKVLATALAAQKSLEGQYQEVQQQVNLWLERAKAAVLQNDDDLAKEALVRKRQCAESAAGIQQALDEATAKVMQIRGQVQLRR